ncbi:pyrroline-5-carboxylate reductase [Niveispirillum sp. SYP-B3756]|uniref:pyrroline-5-carboxylate reductase n=1 Tax=Niveispirillum sp. SYP-B3756 TaxID=2662178 RepID=UPI0012918BF3|nr:pyrroline-5-carboxylate reductase [Niveispirillum sp. SYP-B3756]MQP65260.1 pyrroline-5-carboxylate reductase [Niveispirillum sp. SYP-B3756]
MSAKLLLVGCGKMGGAMLAGWKQADPATRMVVVEPFGPPKGLPDDVQVVTDAADIPADFQPDAIVLAVKPQMMDQVLPAYARYADRALFLSIAAGKTLGYFQQFLGDGARIVRAMPNTPAAVGRGISALVANANVDTAGRALAQRLLSAVGEVTWVAEESQLDAVTAVSGSGPAYVFLLVETLARAGESAGLPPDLAMQLARATIVGSGELLRQSHESAEQLRRNVTSPKGTTQAALDVLMEEGPQGMAALMRRAIAAATQRSRELAG